MTTATKKKSAQEYPDSQNYKQTVKKQINVNNDDDIDGPYNLNDRFKNLQNALKYIQNPHIRGLEKNYFDLKSELKRQQEAKSQFSKAIYKKVISRDNDFNFQHQIYGQDHDITDQFNQRHSQQGFKRSKTEKVQRESLVRKFKHGDMSKQAKRQRLRQQSEIPLNFKHVKAIETPQFQKYKDVQFYDLIKAAGQQKDFEQSGGTEMQTLAIQSHISNFNHSLITQSQYHNKKSYNFLFDCDRQLTFWRLQNIFKEDKKTEQEVLSNCAFLNPANITTFQVFDFGSRNIEINDVIKFYDLKLQLQLKMQNQKNNQSLQQKYNQAKKRFEEMKELRLKSKNQRLPAKFVNSVAQTNDQMEEKDFDDYFVQDAKNIFDRIQELNQIRDRIVQDQDGETFRVMATNIGIEVGKQLFKLLMLVLKGEKTLKYSNFIKAQSQQEVQRKILELIYLQFKNFTEYEVNGVSKVEIIKKYLEYKEKNERFYETFLFKRVAQKQTQSNNAVNLNKKIKEATRQ